jgi:hemoglobin-like flavoprotein
MSPEQLAELRNFFVSFEPRLPQAVALMYSRLLEAMPEARQLFKGDFQEQERRYLLMLWELVRLTRSSQLWPIQPGMGTSTIPAVDQLAGLHSRIGITREHFDQMKAVLVQCFREESPEHFTPAAEEALGFIFDVVAQAAADTPGTTGEEQARKNQLPHHGDIELADSVSKANVLHFWAWFAQEEEHLFNFERDQERVFDQLSTALTSVSPDLTFEFGPVRNGVRNFVISAGGSKLAFPAVEALAAAAPSLPRWNVIKFRPRRNPIMQLQVGDKTVDPDDVQFSLLSNGGELGIYLFFDGYAEEEQGVWGQIGYLLLDEALGEFDLETKVGIIQLLPSDAEPDVRRYPLSRLPELFDEQFANLNHTH